ncbi:MAG: class I SAM-dependent methyltransferase [Candidatus Latescibacterota bacterium]|nr:MAG: class I SAM-dependent methyltransferase [Candidatus Latescibacterota bacterium]
MERGYLPEWLVRRGMRRLISWQITRRAAQAESVGGTRTAVERFANELRHRPVAPVPQMANEQHYEVPAAFFLEVLGGHLKYSCCLWEKDTHDLDEAEASMLDLTIERAGVTDGMNVLELGCGWGAATLAMAERFPDVHVTAVSNSRLQKETIDARARDRGLTNIEVVTADMNDFATEKRFDRVVSVEMFEHMHNYAELMSRISRWLEPDGKLFVHIFSHATYAYFFETEGAQNWMGRYFFTGGIMPSDDLLLEFDDDLEIEKNWRISGTHYEQTANVWADRMEQRRDRIMSIFRKHYGSKEASRWFMRWKVFFWACAETFGYDNGDQWGVSHYLFSRRAR